jgi:organic hydroperoxide reductase OsmC/OhrA
VGARQHRTGTRSAANDPARHSLPGVARDVAQALLDEAHKICPYSKATRGNIDVATNLV